MADNYSFLQHTVAKLVLNWFKFS